MIDDRVLPGRHIGRGAYHAKMSRAYRRHQGLVRLINHNIHRDRKNVSYLLPFALGWKNVDGC
jgi:hypothetical protein